jgi:hypothetical protein
MRNGPSPETAVTAPCNPPIVPNRERQKGRPSSTARWPSRQKRCRAGSICALGGKRPCPSYRQKAEAFAPKRAKAKKRWRPARCNSVLPSAGRQCRKKEGKPLSNGRHDARATAGRWGGRRYSPTSGPTCSAGYRVWPTWLPNG